MHDSLKNQKTGSSHFLRSLALLFLLGATKYIIASYVGFDEPNCDGEDREFTSINDMWESEEFEVLSYHPSDDPSQCEAFNKGGSQTVTAAQTRRIVIDYIFDSPSGNRQNFPSVVGSINRMTNEEWYEVSIDIENCWRDTAIDSGMDVPDRGYTIEIDNTMGAFGIYYFPSNRVKISWNAIIYGAFHRRAQTFAVAVYTHMHEAKHGERLTSGRANLADPNREEQLTAREVYFDYIDAWGTEPPYSYYTEEEIQDLEETYRDDPGGLDQLLRGLRWNGEYDYFEDRITPCE